MFNRALICASGGSQDLTNLLLKVENKTYSGVVYKTLTKNITDTLDLGTTLDDNALYERTKNPTFFPQSTDGYTQPLKITCGVTSPSTIAFTKAFDSGFVNYDIHFPYLIPYKVSQNTFTNTFYANMQSFIWGEKDAYIIQQHDTYKYNGVYINCTPNADFPMAVVTTSATNKMFYQKFQSNPAIRNFYLSASKVNGTDKATYLFAFCCAKCGALREVNMPNLTEITSENAFRYAFYLTTENSDEFTVNMPNLTSVSSGAFYGAFKNRKGLTDNYIIRNITSAGSSAFYEAFYNCGITFPVCGIENIPPTCFESAFENNPIHGVAWGWAKTIGNYSLQYAFRNGTGIINRVQFNVLESIGVNGMEEAFAGCSFNIEDWYDFDFGALKTIDSYGMKKCFAGTSTKPSGFNINPFYSMFQSIETIGNEGMWGAFMHATTSDIKVGEGVATCNANTIRDDGMEYCFYNSANLFAEIKFPNLTTIGYYALHDCFATSDGASDIKVYFRADMETTIRAMEDFPFGAKEENIFFTL